MSAVQGAVHSGGRPAVERSSLRHLFGLAVGIGTQALFAVTVVGLFSFLRHGVINQHVDWLLVDILLALQFAIPHSILLHPVTRRRLRLWISPEFYGVFFCVCTCVSLLLIFEFWRSSSVSVWDLDGFPASCIIAAFYFSWVALLYSISLTGLGFQTGWTQWLHWYRGQQMPRRDFRPRGVYHFFRHPVYLSFLGLIWFTPAMTADHAVLTAVWTVYIYMGSILKDRRLLFYLRDGYESYMRQVPGYPLMFIGPLSRLKGPAALAETADSSRLPFNSAAPISALSGAATTDSSRLQDHRAA